MGKRVSIYRKALHDAVFLTLWNLAVPKLVVKQQNDNDTHAYDLYIHTGVEVGVAGLGHKSYVRVSRGGNERQD